MGDLRRPGVSQPTPLRWPCPPPCCVAGAGRGRSIRGHPSFHLAAPAATPHTPVSFRPQDLTLQLPANFHPRLAQARGRRKKEREIETEKLSCRAKAKGGGQPADLVCPLLRSSTASHLSWTSLSREPSNPMHPCLAAPRTPTMFGTGSATLRASLLSSATSVARTTTAAMARS